MKDKINEIVESIKSDRKKKIMVVVVVVTVLVLGINFCI